MKRLLLFLVTGNKDEWPKISLLLTIGFFMGVYVATFPVATTALFLNHFDNDQNLIPRAFVASGLLGIIITYFFSYLQKRLTFKVLVSFWLTFLLVITVLSAIALNLHYKPDITLFLAFISVGPATAVVVLMFWLLFGRMFSVRAAKRLSGGIDTGQATAAIMTFFTVPLIEPYLPDTANVLFISTISLSLCFASYLLVFKRFKLAGNENEQESMSDRRKKNTYRLSAFQRKYVILMAAFVICSAVAAKFVEYSFLTVTEARFTASKSELNKFLSFFEGTVMICSFLVQTFLNDKILEVYGLKFALLLLPGLLGILLVVSTFIGEFLGHSEATELYAGTRLFFFLMIVISKLVTDALRESLEDPTVKIFFFPLGQRIRFDIQAKIEGVVKEFSGLFAGLLMLGIAKLSAYTVIYNNYVIFLIIACWMYITASMYRFYKRALTETLAVSGAKQKKRASLETKSEIAKTLTQELWTSTTGRAVLVLSLIEKIDPFLFRETLPLFGKLSNEEGKIFCLEKIQEHNLFEARPALEAFIARDTGTNAGEFAKFVLKILDKGQVEALDLYRISMLATSGKAQERIYAAKLIGQHLSEDALKLLVPMLRDLVPEVRREAIITAGLKKIPELLPYLIDQLSAKGYENTAFAALIRYGEDAVSALETAFHKNGQTQKIKVYIVQLYGQIGSAHALELLTGKITYPDRRVVYEVFASLFQCNWEGTGDSLIYVKNALHEECGKLLWNMASQIEVGHTANNEWLHKALDEEIRHNFEEIFMLLSLIYDKVSIQLVKQNIETGSPDSIGYAVELIDVFVEDDIKRYLIPLIDDSQPADKIKKLELEFPREHHQEKEVLRQLVNRDYNWTNRWTKTCAMHSLALMEAGDCIEDFAANFFNPDPLLCETSAWAVYRIDQMRYFQIQQRLSPDIVRALNRIVIDRDEEEKGLPISNLRLEKAIYLSETGLFEGMPGLILAGIVEIMTIRHIKAGTALSEVGAFDKAQIYVLLSGAAALNGFNETEETYGPKDVLVHLLVPGEYKDTGQWLVTENAWVMEINSLQFYEMLAHRPELTAMFLKNATSLLAQQEKETVW